MFREKVLGAAMVIIVKRPYYPVIITIIIILKAAIISPVKKGKAFIKLALAEILVKAGQQTAVVAPWVIIVVVVVDLMEEPEVLVVTSWNLAEMHLLITVESAVMG